MYFTKQFNTSLIKRKSEELDFAETKRKITFRLYNRKIYVYKYLSNNNKILFWVHGICSDHRVPRTILKISKKYEYSIYSIDLPGHGMSKPVGITTFSECLESIYSIIQYLKDTDRYPVSFIGHSMGSSILVHYLAKMRRTKENVILLAPPFLISTKQDINSTIYLWKYIIKAVLFPNSFTNINDQILKLEFKRIYNRIFKKCSRNRGFSCKYQNKCLCDLVINILRTPYYIKRIESPNTIYIVHGDKDEVCDVKGSVYAYSILKEKGISSKLYVVRDADHSFEEFNNKHLLKVMKILLKNLNFQK